MCHSTYNNNKTHTMVFAISFECLGVLIFTKLCFLWLCEAELTPISVIGKTASQSSSHPHYPARNAIDGSTRSFTHTAGIKDRSMDLHPWWQVDLGAEHCVGRITVVLRQGCCDQYRFTGARARAGLSSTYSGNQPCGSPATRAQSATGSTVRFLCDSPPRMASYVSLDIDRSNPDVTNPILQLAEVRLEVYMAAECLESDFSLVGKTASQSTTHTPRVAGNAVDGSIWTFSHVNVKAGTWCPQGWHNWRDSCYLPLTESLTWDEALKACHRPRSSLLIQNSREEHQFIMDLRDKSFSAHRKLPLWIGCEILDNDIGCHGYNSGASVFGVDSSYIREMPGRQCLYKGPRYPGSLFSGDCSQHFFVICEMSQPVTTRSYCVSLDANGRVSSPCLLGHDFKNLTASEISECSQACWEDIRCHSFNIWQPSTSSICQLNNATINEVGAPDFVDDAKCLYFEL